MDNTNTAEIENDNNDKVAKSDNNDDNPIMSDKESPLGSPAEDNEEKDEEGEIVQKKYLHLSSMADKQMTQQKLSRQKGIDLLRSHPWNPQWVIHKKAKIKIKIKKPQIH